MQPVPAGPPAPSSMSRAIPSSQIEFSVGRTIARTFSTWWRHVFAFSILTIGAMAPFWVVALAGGLPIAGVNAPANPFERAAEQMQPAAPPWFWPAYAATLLLFLVEMGAITYGVIQHLAGNKVSLGGMIAAGVKRAVPLLLVGVLCYLAVLLGFLLLVVPGIWLACALAVAMPAVVVERPGIFGALKRSFAITKGKRFSIFVVFLVLFIVMLATATLVMVFPMLTASFSPLAGVVIGQIVNASLGTIFWVVPGVVYHDLRVAKEGVETAQLAAVFE